MQRIFTLGFAASLSLLATLATTGCASTSADEDGIDASESEVNASEQKLSITFRGCVARFRGKGVSFGTLPHDGIERCSQDDGSYSLGGYHLDVVRAGDGPDASRVIAGVTMRDGDGEKTMEVTRAALAGAQGLKVWFGGHDAWLTADDLPSTDAMACTVTLIGNYQVESKSYAKTVELECTPL